MQSCSQQTTTLNMDLEFATEIPEAHNFQQISGGNNTISCYTDDSKKNDQVGTVVHITEGVNLVKEESYHLGPNSTVFQAETFALGETARILREKNTAGKNIIINSDSQASIMAVTSTQIKSKTSDSATVSE